MPCPRCHGDAREPIAPGFWRCTTVRTELVPLGPHPGRPGIVQQERRVVCGTEYQQGGATAACACGTFAIGQCTACGRPVCGYHSALVAGRRLCADELAAMETQRQRERDAIQAAKDAARERWTGQARAVLAPQDDIARIVMTMAAIDLAWDYQWLPQLLIADLAPADPEENWHFWDDDAVRVWFLRSVTAAPPESIPRVRFKRGVLGGEKRVVTQEPGWTFAVSGASVVVWADGRPLFEGHRFTPHMLGQMAALTGLPALPPIPPR
jgi:hypothetical protein